MAKFNMIIQAKTLGQAGIKRMGNSMQGLQGRLKNVRMAALSVNTAFKAMAVILTAGAVTRFAKGAIDQADAFGKLSRQTGIAAGTLQSYVNAGKLAGVEQTTIEKSLRRLAQSMREADQGVATYKDAYEALGVEVRDADGNLKTSQQVLGEMANEFKDMENGATKAALAMEIFGRSGSQIIPMLNEGSEALLKWNYQTSEEFSQNAEYFNDQLTMLGFGFDGFRKQLSDALLPALNSIIEAFRELFSTQNDWQALFEVIGFGVRTLSFGLLSSVVLVEELVNTLSLGLELLNKFRKGDFKGMDKARGEFLKDFGDRFNRNKGLFDAIIGGESNAPAEYFKEGTKAAKELASQMNQTFGDAMKDKLEAFAKSLGSVGSQIGDVVVKAFKGMEDALVTFVTTGKMAFADFARSIMADMARIAIRQAIIKPLLSAFTSFITPAKPATPTPTPGKALGGPVVGGASYLVGEQGPEVFTPTGNGNITSNHVLAMDRYRSTGTTATADGVMENGGSISGGGAAVIDLRYDVERINQIDYVTATQFQQGMSQAAREGAKRGEQATLHRLQTSASTRRRVGV